MSRSIDEARFALESQPFSRLVKAEVLQYSPDAVELRLPISEEVKQQHGFVHGGVVSYLADNALTFAGGAALGPNVVTSEYKINYLRPATGNFLVARASVVYQGKTQAVCRCDLYAISDAGEKLCAVAQGTISLMGTPSPR